jgi:phosphoribosylglycinamide formyltransferase-1
VLVSGTGTILEALISDGIPVVVAVADRPCRGLEIAADAGIATELVDRRDFGGFGERFGRDAFTERLVDVLARHRVDLVAMAGFGTVVTQAMHAAYPDRILNTHPALLPAFPGWHAVEDALAAGVAVTGCTVHVATLDMDAGPVLAQQEVVIEPGDTAASLHERIKRVERRLYPATIRRVAAVLDEDPTRPIATLAAVAVAHGGAGGSDPGGGATGGAAGGGSGGAGGGGAGGGGGAEAPVGASRKDVT